MEVGLVTGTLYTWGYRGRTVETLQALVRRHGIKRVIDVRRTAGGMYVGPGWTSTRLRPRLKQYEHQPNLGNPAAATTATEAG